MKFIKPMLLICLSAALLVSCGYMKLVGDEVKDSFGTIDSQSPAVVAETRPEPTSALMGTVSGQMTEDGPLMVAVFSKRYFEGQNVQTTQLIDYVSMPAPGPYIIFVAAGQYSIYAFVDSNQNYILEPEELVGQHGAPDIMSVKEHQVVGRMDIDIGLAGKERFEFPVSLQKMPLREINDRSLENGGVVGLDDAIFFKKHGELGFWQPDEFIMKIGADIYALEPYDPSKTPLLFVHGAAGTPRDWLYLAQRVDRQKFQPWFYFYPTGFRLAMLSDLLYEKTRNLYRMYGFDRMFVAAHSMGGLVARSFINRCSRENTGNVLRAFVTVSAPWGGEKSANLGVHSAPVQVASWEDMATDSSFLDDLHRQELPPQVNYYLLFSFGGSKPFHWSANDGTVTLESQLDPRAMSAAVLTFGISEDHLGVLHSEETGDKFAQILEKEHLSNASETAFSTTPPPSAVIQSAGSPQTLQEVNSPEVESLPPEVQRYADMLRSKDSAKQREAARRIYRKRIKHRQIFDAAEKELLRGYLINLNDNSHIDAMAWMCTLLGTSGLADYHPTLEKVVKETPNSKIKKYARKNLRLLK